MYLRIFEICVLKHYHLDTAHFYAVPELAWQTLLKPASEYCEREVTCKECELCPDKFILELLTNIEICWCLKKIYEVGLLQWKAMLKTGISTWKSINRDETSIYLQYLNTNNLYEWAMIRKLPTHGFVLEEKNNCFTVERKVNW